MRIDDVTMGIADDPAVTAAATWRRAEFACEAARTRSATAERSYFDAQQRGGRANGKTYCAAQSAYDQAWERHWEALAGLYTTVPGTLEGVIQMIAVMLESDDGTLDHPDIPEGLANVLACLKRIHRDAELTGRYRRAPGHRKTSSAAAQ